MIRVVLKFVVSAMLVVAVSEIAKRSVLLGGFLGALPLVSLLAFVWLYQDTHDAMQVASLSMSIFWFVLPSLVLFVLLPIFLKRGIGFYPALGASAVVMLACSGATTVILRFFGVER